MAENDWPETGGAAGRNPCPRGGGGPARCVPTQPEGEGASGRYHDVQEVEAGTVAREVAAWSSGSAAIPRRSWGRRRPDAVADEPVDLGHEEVQNLVKTVRKEAIK